MARRLVEPTLAEVVLAVRLYDILIEQEIAQSAQTGNSWLSKLRYERGQWFQILDAKRSRMTAKIERTATAPRPIRHTSQQGMAKGVRV